MDTLEIGALYRGQVRRFLQEAKYAGQIESFMESKGWLESKFLIHGMTSAAKATLTRWMQENAE